MPSTWRKVENEQGFPYYLNESNNTKQWDHPKFIDIKQRLDDCNYVKYSMYRVASKFRVLQHALFMDEVPLTIINGVFERHRLGTTEGSLCLENCDLEAVLSDIYFAANKQNHTNVDIDYGTEIMVNFLYNVFDKERLGKTQVFSTKLLLAILSKCKLAELFKFIFYLLVDHNNCITRVRLQTALNRLTDVTTFLHEDVNFGTHLILSSVDGCFVDSPGLVGVNESFFTAWLESGPPLLAWIPTLFRMKSAENVVHATRCSVCKASPLLGLRYRCLRCYRYNLCQYCFFSVRISHGHKNNHPVREYSSESSSRDFTHSLVKKLCSLIRCTIRTDRPSPGTNFVEPKNLSMDKEWFPVEAIENETFCNVTPLSSPQAQLQVIIRQLEIQNQEFQQHISSLNNENYAEMNKYFEEHRLHIAVQIRKLKVLKDLLKNKDTDAINKLESTPMTFKQGRCAARGAATNLFSPILYVPECSVVQEGAEDDRTYRATETTTSNPSYTCQDISTWLGGQPSTSNYVTSLEEPKITHTALNRAPIREMQNDLDSVLDKLQQILANNFILDESLGSSDNGQLKNAVTEMEGMLSSLIDNVESSRSSSTQSRERETLLC